MKQLAKNVKVLLGGSSPIAGLTDCSLNLTTAFATSETKEDATPVDEPLRVDWEISISGEFGHEVTTNTNAGSLKSSIKKGTKTPITFVIGSLAQYSGQSLITSYSESAAVEGRTTYSATFKGIGKLTKAAVAATNEEE